MVSAAMRPVATPARCGGASLLSCLEPTLLSAAHGLLEKLPEQSRADARRELSRRISPEIQARTR